MAVKNKATVTPVWEMLQITEAEWRKNPGAIIAAAKLIVDGRGADISALMFGAPAAGGHVSSGRLEHHLQNVASYDRGLAIAIQSMTNAASCVRAWLIENAVDATAGEVAAFTKIIMDFEPRANLYAKAAAAEAVARASPNFKP